MSVVSTRALAAALEAMRPGVCGTPPNVVSLETRRARFPGTGLEIALHRNDGTSDVQSFTADEGERLYRSALALSSGS